MTSILSSFDTPLALGHAVLIAALTCAARADKLRARAAQRHCRRKVDRGSGKWGRRGRRDGVSRVSAAPGVREMTELTPESCHILFSASLRSVGGRGTEKGKSLQARSRGSWRDGAKPAEAEGPKPDSFSGLGPDAVHQRPPIGWWMSESCSPEGSQEWPGLRRKWEQIMITKK